MNRLDDEVLLVDDHMDDSVDDEVLLVDFDDDRLVDDEHDDHDNNIPLILILPQCLKNLLE